MIAIVGQEIAEVLAPFAKWGALVGGALTLVGLVVWRIRKSARAEKELDAITESKEERQDAANDLRRTRGRFRAAWRRVRNKQVRTDPAA